MSQFQIVEEFQKFLESRQSVDPEYVRREVYYLAANCAAEGLDLHVPLYPLFLNPEIVARYDRFGQLVHLALERILEVLMQPEHPAGPLMRSFLTIQPEIERILMTQPRGGVMPRVIRPDTVLHENRIITHEFNVSWPGGISDSDIIVDMLGRNDLYRDFAGLMAEAGHPIPEPPPFKSTSLLLDEILEAADTDNPYIAVVIATPDVPGFDGDQIKLSERICNFIQEQGHEVDLMYARDVEYDGTPHHQGRKIDVVYRIFEWGHVMNYHTEEYEPLIQAYCDGNLPVVNSFHGEALSAKSIFELLHCEELHPLFDDLPLDELLDAIPYTVNIARVDEPEEIVEQREEWVLKRIKGSSGDAVLIGPETDDETWEHAVRHGVETGSMVLQEYVDSPMMLMSMFPGEDLVQVPRYVDLGPLLFSGRVGNFLARFSSTMMTSFVSMGGGMFPVMPME